MIKMTHPSRPKWKKFKESDVVEAKKHGWTELDKPKLKAKKIKKTKK